MSDRIDDFLDKICASVKYNCNSISDYVYYVNKFNNYGAHHGLTEIKGENNIENPIEKLAFVGEINEHLKKTYDYMVKNNLCFYDEVTEKLGLVSAFDDNAAEYLKSITNDIFKTE